MAKKPNTIPPADPLSSPAGRAWLTRELAYSETHLADGPNGSWLNNEALRPEIAERTAFLRALVALLP